MGDSGTLAAEYLDAELGPGPRHSWLAAGVFLLTTVLLLDVGALRRRRRLRRRHPRRQPDADGTFTWPGIGYLQTEVTYTVSGGEHSFVGGAFTPLT